MARAPRALPLVGHAPSFLADKLGFLERAASTLGDVAPLQLSGRAYLLNDPSDIRHVLVGNHANYVKTLRLTGAKGRRLFGDGLLRSTGEAHRRRRLALQPLFHHRCVELFAGAVLENAERLADSWEPAGEVDVAEAMSRLAQRNVIRTLFGRLPEGELEQLARAIDARRRYIDHAFLSLLPVRESLPTPVRRGYRRAMAELESAIGAAIAARRASPGERTDLVSLLLDARGEDGEPLSDRDVRDEVLTLSITGFETLGDALSWTWYLLALHPACYERLVRELDAELEGRRPRVEDLPRLRYARQVLAESLRLYPPTWVYVRTALAADVLPSGAGIEAGAKLYLSPYVTQRDPRHFPEPERFDPGRFEPDAVRARPKLAYFPFGSGPHVCIGEAFARMEAGLTLARLAQRFRLELVDRREVVPDPRITLSPREPIRMLVVERARSVTAPRRPSGGRAAAR